jgi:putative ATPase
MDLFDHQRELLIDAEAPLAARMRPRTLDEFVGQGAIVGKGRLLRRAIQADQLSSLLFYGPPGTGKTTLARIIANTTEAHFIAINAVLSGVQAIRDAISVAQEKRGLYQQKTILFIDEVHRFNKSQQDALLPWVENGTVILIGATTENPYFEVNKALVSRSRLFQLKPLQSEDLKQIAHQALNDSDRGYGDRRVVINDDALDHLVNIANGDARTLLNALELSVSTTIRNDAGMICITLAIAEESIQQRAVLYDKEGDAHFDIISAFIKSLRGSDPDAAMYWLARMMYAGEDPRFIFRRMVIFAGEDVGMAEPQAIVVVNSCAMAFDRVGMPEGRYPLAQAALYLATCAKSNSVMGFFDALAMVEKEREAEVPNPLRDNSRDQEGFGHGKGYLYPHSYRDHWVAQQYLPTALQGQVFYQPSNQGYELKIANTVARQREAQLASIVDANPEQLSTGPIDRQTDQWLQRTLSQTGANLGAVRDRIFDKAKLQRHHVVLDLNAGSGLLTWEAVRRVPEGGVYACGDNTQTVAALQEQASALPQLIQPIVLTVLNGIDDLIPQLSQQLQFNCILGRNIYRKFSENAVESLSSFLDSSGRWILAETIPQAAQRLYSFLDRSVIDTDLYDRLSNAEECHYQANGAQYLDLDKLNQIFVRAGFIITIEKVTSKTELYVSEALCDRWFGPNSTYIQQLSEYLDQIEIETIRQFFLIRLLKQTVTFEGTIAYITAMCSYDQT